MHGQAIVRGLRLTEMDSSDMLDVIHYFFEVDHQMATAEEAEAKSNIRTQIYQSLYNKNYKYQYKSQSSSNSYNYSTTTASGEPLSDGFVGGVDADDPLAPEKGPTKPFVPATEFNPDSPNPFGGTLDPPSG